MFQSEQMGVIGLPQSDSAAVMVAAGVTGFLNRIVVVPLLGDYIKGHIMEVYITISL